MFGLAAKAELARANDERKMKRVFMEGHYENFKGYVDHFRLCLFPSVAPQIGLDEHA
jgi:hypothetical protein